MATTTRSHSTNGTSSGNGSKSSPRRSPEPRLGQRGKELQRFGTLRQLPIALSAEARTESCQLLNEILETQRLNEEMGCAAERAVSRPA